MSIAIQRKILGCWGKFINNIDIRNIQKGDEETPNVTKESQYWFSPIFFRLAPRQRFDLPDSNFTTESKLLLYVAPSSLKLSVFKNLNLYPRQNPEAYLEPSWTSKMKFFATIVNYWKLLTITAQHSISDIRLGLKMPLKCAEKDVPRRQP